MESSYEGATGKDSVSPWCGASCGSGFYRHVSDLFGGGVLGVIRQKEMEGSSILSSFRAQAASSLHGVCVLAVLCRQMA